MFNEPENMKTQNGAVIAIASMDFKAKVLKSPQPVLVAFWAPWSRPCQVLDSVLHEVTFALDGIVKVVQVNVDDSLDLSLCYEIQCIPTLVCFVEGTPRLRIVGTATKDAIIAKLKASRVLNETVILPPGDSGEGRQPGKEN